MVRSGELLLIDVAFVQVRPSPWRQAVDLGNMMLVLGRAHRPAAGLPAGAGVLHRSRARRSIRRHPRGRQPDPTARLHETGPARPARRIPRPRPTAAADRAATLEHRAGRSGGRDARRHHRRPGGDGECLLPGSRKSGRLRPQLRHRPFDDPQRPGSPVRCPAAPASPRSRRAGALAARTSPAGGQPLAGLRSRRAASGHRNPHCDLRHLGRPADPLRPARHAPLRSAR